MSQSEMIVALTAIILGSLTILVPVAAFSLRFASKPLVEAFARFKDMRLSEDEFTLLRERIAFLEQRLESVERDVERIGEAKDFDRQLANPSEKTREQGGAAGF